MSERKPSSNETSHDEISGTPMIDQIRRILKTGENNHRRLPSQR